MIETALEKFNRFQKELKEEEENLSKKIKKILNIDIIFKKPKNIII